MIGLLGEIATAISSYGFGTIGASLFQMPLPTTPYLATAVYVTGGYKAPGEPLRRPSFLLLHRNTDVRSGTAFVTRLNSVLDGSVNLICHYPGRINGKSLPGWTGSVDKNNCYLFSLNYVLSTIKVG